MRLPFIMDHPPLLTAAEGLEGMQMQTMTSLRWLAAATLVLAILCRAAWRHIPFDLGHRVSPEVNHSVPIGIVFFWGFLFLSVVLALISFLRHAQGR
jgi:hypothetical protein